MAYLFGKEFTRRELMQRVGDISQVGGIREYTLDSGKAKGVSAFEINTGTGFKFTVLPDRSMDIAWADYKGVPLSWISKSGIASPGFFEHRGTEFLRNFFGGMVTTCGLRQTGWPCTCDGEDFGLHGRISNTPAGNVSARACWQDDDYIMEVRGQMRESVLFGENLLLERTIATRLGYNKFTISDTITNEGFRPEGIMVLYHFNFGFPLVDEGARIEMPEAEPITETEVAAKGVDTLRLLHAPVLGYAEQCFFMDFKKEKKVRVGITNERLAHLKGIYLEYDKSQLPWFTIWKMLGESDYVIGLEPGTCYPMSRERAKREGRLVMLNPFESYTAEIEVGIAF